MKILIDTNILIPLEDTSRQLDPRMAELKRGVDKYGYHLFIHPEQIKDIERDRDESRKKIVLSRIRQYNRIPNPPTLSADEISQYGWTDSNVNDHIDNLLLHALKRGAVDVLITEDEGIHSKAKKVNIQDQVYRLEQILALFDEKLIKLFQVPYGVSEHFLYEFSVEQTFFDSLREGYPDFNEWYSRVSREHRKCWCITDEQRKDLHAICIYKEEESPSITDDGLRLEGKALKLCTLKVDENLRGRKIGERLLYTAFKYAFENIIDYVYIHTDPEKHDHLISLCSDYGFINVGSYNCDHVFKKDMRIPPDSDLNVIDPLECAIKYYPHYRDDSAINKFLIPIQSNYHEELFPDISNFSQGLFSNLPEYYNPQSNTIKKAYLCHSNITVIKRGDLILFYRTGDRKSIQVIGVVENSIRSKDINKVLSIVSKRTVFNLDELEGLLIKDTLVILFRLIKYIPQISYTKLQKIGIHGPIQSIREISHSTYLNLMREID